MSIYLDNAATTKVKPEVVTAMMPYLIDKWYNPSSLYSEAVEVKNNIESARETIADFIGAKRDEIFFTSGGSEGNCWAIDGFCKEVLSHNRIPIVITTKIEHKSILECVQKSLCSTDGYYVIIPVDNNGFVDLVTLQENLEYYYNQLKTDVLVSIQIANNEIGTIQDIESISKLVHKYEGILHVDAVQAFGQIPINVKELNIDMMTVSGHKIGAPKGIGFLYKNYSTNIKPLIYGSQMDGMRGGTENTAYIMGFSKAIELCNISAEKISELCKKRDYFISKLIKEFGCKLNGDRRQRLPNNINVTFPQNITGESMLYMLDISKIYTSTSSACNSHSIIPSQVLKSIGLTDEEAMKTIRISISEDITYKDIDYIIDEIKKSIQLIS